jgi:hypothetical protein
MNKGIITGRTQCATPNTAATPQSFSDSDVPFGITFWKIGEWVIHILSWLACGVAFYWIRDAVHPVLFIIMVVMFLRLEYNMIVKGKKSF